MYNETNNYCEVSVRREIPRKVAAAGIAYLVLAALSLVMTFLMTPLYLILVVAALAARWKILTDADLEFEYQFWGRQLDIECIVGGRIRKKLETYMMDDVELLAREGDEVLETYFSRFPTSREARIRDLTDQDPEGRTVYLMYVLEDEPVCVRFQPSHEMLRQMWRTCPSRVHISEQIKKDPEEWE